MICLEYRYILYLYVLWFIVLLIFPVLILSVGISKLTLQIVNLYLMWTPEDEMFADYIYVIGNFKNSAE